MQCAKPLGLQRARNATYAPARLGALRAPVTATAAVTIGVASADQVSEYYRTIAQYMSEGLLRKVGN